MIALRRQHTVFGRGTIEFIRTDNRKVLTYVRRHEQQTILCIANLARTVQPVSVPLAQFAGLTPVETARTDGVPAHRRSALLPHARAYGFYWFALQREPSCRSPPVPRQSPEKLRDWPVLFAGVVWDSLIDGSLRGLIENARRCCRSSSGSDGLAASHDASPPLASSTGRCCDGGAHPAFLAIVDVAYRDGGSERYTLPLAMSTGARR